ncbi:hypothetical protein IVB22_00845 [Bradyrhizobium sp. 190]|nr:hypothetical protein [Bradyrhizobium sp. 190]MCK1511140.1 hypothetical protein [Bradyrhizobium sp. 190]
MIVAVRGNYEQSRLCRMQGSNQTAPRATSNYLQSGNAREALSEED